jgi:hypothetical protein
MIFFFIDHVGDRLNLMGSIDLVPAYIRGADQSMELKSDSIS